MKHTCSFYDKEENPNPLGFKYCPKCRETLVMQESGNKSRPTCPACGYIQYVNPAPVVSVLIVEEDRVLLGRRRTEPCVGKWGLPSGFIEFDDDFLTAAIKEVKEETGLDVEIRSIANVITTFFSSEMHYLAVMMTAEVVGGELAALDDLDIVDWFPLTGPFPEMAFPEDMDTIEDYRSGKISGIMIDRSDGGGQESRG